MTFSPVMRIFIETIRTLLTIDATYSKVFNAIVKSTDGNSHELDVEKFEQHLLSLPAPKSSKTHTWNFYLPANFAIQRPSNRWRPIVSGQRFELNSTMSSRNQYSRLLTNAPYHIRVRCRNPKRATKWPGYILFTANGATCSAAFQSIEQQFQLLRGVLELVLGGGTFSHSFPARTPRRIELESWAIAENELGEVDFVGFNWLQSSFSDILDLQSPTKIEDEHILACFRAKHRIKPTDTKLISYLLRKALIQLADSVDQLLPTDQLLHLWQITETITLASRHGGNTDMVCKRFAHHFSYRGTIEYDTIKIMKLIAQFRNNMVHQGDSDNLTESLVSELKVECCNAIWWLLWRCEDFKTIDRLEWWYNLNSLPDQRLANCRDIANLVLADR